MPIADECLKNCVEGASPWPVAVAAVVAAFIAAAFAIWRMRRELGQDRELRIQALSHDRDMRLQGELRMFIDDAGRELLAASDVLRKAVDRQRRNTPGGLEPADLEELQESIDEKLSAVVGIGRRFYLHLDPADDVNVAYSEAQSGLLRLADLILSGASDTTQLSESLAEANIATQEFLITARTRVRAG